MEQNQNRKRQRFILQWHITGKCSMNCMHCYRLADTYNSELENELGYDDCIRVLDDLGDTVNKWGIPCRLNFSGGDPLMRDDICDLIKYANSKGIATGILGNPVYINCETAKKLKEAGITHYQVSIDGMEKMHDTLRRKKGSFKDALRAIDVLEHAGMKSVVMFTLSKKNEGDLIDVIKLVAGRCSVFDFARMVPVGAGECMGDQTFTPDHYREILTGVMETYRDLSGKGCKTRFGKKEPLWALLEHELGILKRLPENKTLIYGGCSIGMNGLSILADGTVYACRRLAVEIGKVPAQKIGDIFTKSETLNYMRESENIEGCGNCELKQVCRGCRAISYAASGNYMGRDPQCWRGLI